MKYKSVCARLRLRLLPVLLAASLVQAPLAVCASEDSTANVVTEPATETTTEKKAAAKSEPAPEPDPAPAEPAPAPEPTPAPDPAPTPDPTPSQGEGGETPSGNEGGEGGQEGGGQQTGGDEGGTGGGNEGGSGTEGNEGSEGTGGEGTEGGGSDSTDPTDPLSGDVDPAGGDVTDPEGEVPETPATSEVLEPEEEELPEGAELAEGYGGSNDALIAAQHIVSIPPEMEDFRFYSVNGTKALLRSEAWLYEKRDTGSEKVGHADMYSTVFILDQNDGWAYVETADVRGFVQLKALAVSEEKDALLNDLDVRRANLQEKLAQIDIRIQAQMFRLADRDDTAVDRLNILKDALAAELAALEQEPNGTVTALVPWYENDAFLYTRGTSLKHIANKEYALAAASSSVYETRSLSARKVGSFAKGTLLYILQKSGGWYYVESGDVRGYVRSSDLEIGKSVTAQVRKDKEDSFTLAETLVDPADNHALYDSTFSIYEGHKVNPIRRQILELAEKSIGCPYVWGGTDLYHGADCSGFVQSLYRAFGYSIPRVACDQARCGTQIPVSDAMPGDLIFFARNGYVYHVAMYWGDGVTIEAYSSGRGITQVANVTSRDAVWAVRILE